jgi:hypothetical protein
MSFVANDRAVRARRLPRCSGVHPTVWLLSLPCCGGVLFVIRGGRRGSRAPVQVDEFEHGVSARPGTSGVGLFEASGSTWRADDAVVHASTRREGCRNEAWPPNQPTARAKDLPQQRRHRRQQLLRHRAQRATVTRIARDLALRVHREQSRARAHARGQVQIFPTASSIARVPHTPVFRGDLGSKSQARALRSATPDTGIAPGKSVSRSYRATPLITPARVDSLGKRVRRATA